MREVARRWPLVWRGGAFSLGSVEDPDDPAPDPARLRRFLRLSEAVEARGLIETIGFRRLGERDLGRAQRLPSSKASADWIAVRRQALQRALALPVALQLPRTGEAPPAGDLDLLAFLDRIADREGCEFALTLSDLAQASRELDCDVRETARRFARLPVATLAFSAVQETDFEVLAVALEFLRPRALLLRRDENLYPLDEIAASLRRAATALAGVSEPPNVSSAAAEPIWDREGVAALQQWEMSVIEGAFAAAGQDLAPSPQARLASETLAGKNWRERIEDTYKGQQIKKFLSAEARGPI